MGKVLREKWNNFRERWNKLSDSQRDIITLLVVVEAALFERFFYSPEIKVSYYGFLTAFNFMMHVIVFFPFLSYLFLNNKRK